MSWAASIKIKPKTDKKLTSEKYEYPVLKLEDGFHKLRIVEEPVEPINGKYGKVLRFVVEKGGQRYAWLITYREEVDENSILGQLLEIKNRVGNLADKTLLIRVKHRNGKVLYKITDKCPVCGRVFSNVDGYG